MNDPVNYPKHYTSHPSGVEAIEITEHFNFCLGNVIKHIWRANGKGGLEDLRKAQFYLNREIERKLIAIATPIISNETIADDDQPSEGIVPDTDLDESPAIKEIRDRIVERIKELKSEDKEKLDLKVPQPDGNFVTDDRVKVLKAQGLCDPYYFGRTGVVLPASAEDPVGDIAVALDPLPEEKPTNNRYLFNPDALQLLPPKGGGDA